MVEQLQHFSSFYVSHDSTARFLRGAKNIILILLFPTVKIFENRLTADKVIAKKFDTMFFKNTVYLNFVLSLTESLFCV